MKKIVLAGFVVLFAFIADAQTFKSGDAVEINKELSEEGGSWIKADVVDVDLENKRYSVKTADRRLYRIPFVKEESWIRKPAIRLTNSLQVKDETMVFRPSVELLKQKIQENFDGDFSEYDSVIITYNSIQVLPQYRNTDGGVIMPDSDVSPFKVDFTLRLINRNEDGTERKINWQFKRKYLLYQDKKGKTGLSLADKEEEFLSHI